MNNKIFKRIVAAAAGVAMLGTCAFATTLADVTFEKDTLSFTYEVASGASKVTYLAYAATVAGEDDETFTTVDGTKYVLGNIVAVNQLDEIPETKSEAVAISEDLLGEATNIVLMSGDDLGSDVAYAAVATTSAPATETYTVKFLKADGTDYEVKTEVAKDTAISTLIPATDPEKVKASTDKLAWGFVGWYTDAELTTKLDKTAVVASDMTLYPKFISVRIVGDVTLDGKINAADLSMIKVLAGNRTNTNTDKFEVGATLAEYAYTYNGKNIPYVNGDVTGDGKINAADISMIKVLAGNRTNTNTDKLGVGKPVTVVKD